LVLFRVALVVLLLGLGLSGAAASDATTPTGRWMTANQQAVIQISPCGQGLCGQIVGIAVAHPGDKMPMDWQGHPQCGLTILQTAPAADASGQTVWVGQVQDPRSGAIYHAQLMFDALRHLVLHGYLGLPIFGQTQTWTPYAGRTLANCKLAGDAKAGGQG